ncbi:transcriptional regulator LicR [Halanaerocella petrolearia]
MKLPNKRSGKILRILLNREESIVIKELATEFDVSTRTIRSDLNKLEQCLEEREVELIKRPRVGVWLEGDDIQKAALERKLFEVSDFQESLSPVRRHKYILKCLLQTDYKYTIQSLAEELYVSRATIYKDIEKVTDWLAQYNLSLERRRNYGIEVKGTEKNWRKAVADLLAELKDDQELKEILEEETSIELDSRIDSQTYQQLKGLFNNINFRQIEKILKEAESELEFLFTDEALVGLITHIAISVERLTKDKDIKMDKGQLSNLQEKEEFKVAEFIAEKLEQKLNIELPIAEIGYISLHILGAKLQQNIQTTNITDVLDNADPKVIRIAQEIISITEEVLDVELTGDDQLLVGLVLHLRPAINRLKYGMNLRNPLLDRIKADYPSVFGAAWATSIVFERHLGIKVNEEEIGYIALHLGAALERVSKELKAIIVCGSGIGTSQLVASRLAKSLSGLEIIDMVAAHELKNRDLAQVDIIISTIPLADLSQPVVQVSPLVTKNDINLIKDKVNYILQDKQKQKFNLDSKEQGINTLFRNELIFIDLDLSTKEEVIDFLSNKLLKEEKVKPEFIQSALDREEMTSTGVGNKVAIPHGKEDYVLDSQIAIATLEQSIDWGTEKVEVVFMLALKNQESKVFFNHFHRIIDNQEILKKLKETQSKKKIKEIISTEG